MDNPAGRLQALIARKRREDPEGFQKAEKNSDLLYYLSEDMRKMNIDKSILTSHLRRANEQSPVITQVKFPESWGNILSSWYQFKLAIDASECACISAL